MCATSKGSDQPAYTHSLIRAFARRLNILRVLIKLLTEHHLEFLSLKGDCTGWYESTLVKMPHCWKSHITAQLYKSEKHKCISSEKYRSFKYYSSRDIVGSQLCYCYVKVKSSRCVQLSVFINFFESIISTCIKMRKEF